MEESDKTPIQPPGRPNPERATEIAYHKGLNRWLASIATPVFIFFSLFHARLGDSLQSLLFGLLAVNAIGGLLLGVYIQSVPKLVTMKRVTAGIAFSLLAVSFLIGIFSADSFYIFFPWIFIYPIAVMLFFGQRIGLMWALVFSWAMVALLLTVSIPAWDPWFQSVFRSNAVFALLTVLAIALIAERYRVRVQQELVAAREKYKAAEERQREANVELQREVERRACSEEALAQSEMRYRALFEESAVSLWEENWFQLKAFLDHLPAAAQADLNHFFQNHPEQLTSCYEMMVITGVNQASVRLFDPVLQDNGRKVAGQPK